MESLPVSTSHLSRLMVGTTRCIATNLVARMSNHPAVRRRWKPAFVGLGRRPPPNRDAGRDDVVDDSCRVLAIARRTRRPHPRLVRSRSTNMRKSTTRSCRETPPYSSDESDTADQRSGCRSAASSRRAAAGLPRRTPERGKSESRCRRSQVGWQQHDYGSTMESC